MTDADVAGNVWSAPAEGRSFVEDLEVLTRLPSSPTGRPPLLFVHAASHAAWTFDEHWMPEAASRGWPCHAVSVRGHGASRGHDRRLRTERIRDYVDDVMQVVIRLREPPVMVGHSMGALVVEHILARYPAVAGVLVTPIGHRHGLGFGWRTLRRHPAHFVAELGRDPGPIPADYLFAEGMDPRHARAYADRMVPESTAALLQLIGVRRPRPSLAPVLVLGGADDPVIPPIDVVRTARHYGTRAHLFRGMGHSVMLEPGWRAPLDLMLGWLEERVRRD